MLRCVNKSAIFKFKPKVPWNREEVNMASRKRKRDPDSAKIEHYDHEHWLLKSEPESRIEKGVDVKFGVSELKASPEQTACWDGVRNYQARNNMIAMKKGQKAFFYHSNCKVPGIAAIIEIAKESYVDHTQFDKRDPHYDPKSSKDNPRWKMVDVKFVRDLERFIPLAELKSLHLEHKKKGGGPLSNLALFTSARLSVQPLTKEEFEYIIELEKS